jgi:L,D-transpeptidase YcbB
MTSLSNLGRTVLVLICAFAIFRSGNVKAAEGDQLSNVIVAELERGAARRLGVSAHGHDPATIDRAILGFYRSHDFQPFWFEGGQRSKRADMLKQAAQLSQEDGLEPGDYFLDLIEQRWNKVDLVAQAQLDILLTMSLSRLVADAREGRLVPKEIDSKLFAGAKPQSPDLSALIQEVLSRQDLAQAIAEQFPQHKQYRMLKSLLAEYRHLAAKGGWGAVPAAGPALKIGSQGARAEALVKLLSITGDLPAQGPANDVLGAEVEAAVKAFQGRHGLAQSGVVDAATLSAMNVPVEERVLSLVINLERWRWLGKDVVDDKFVLVNIANYEVLAMEQGELALRLPAIVGKTYHATPVFSDRIRHIEFNPYWNVTPSIAQNEMLPKLKKNPGYLANQHMRLYGGYADNAPELNPRSIDWSAVTKSGMNRYRIRQDPGPWNALGVVKFVFPNSYNVYLHDTSTRGLFAERNRTFSHGCIRVSSPLKLAAFLLNQPGDPWSLERVQAIVAADQNKAVRLARPVPIHMLYRTAWVDRDGSAQFRPDIYKRDARIAQALAQSANRVTARRAAQKSAGMNR